uniref:B-cell receptor CD22 n=1 Tax=Erpetoichthys calabaricus TaxID=27687 RepID=A0A8C4SX18_ERPCA
MRQENMLFVITLWMILDAKASTTYTVTFQNYKMDVNESSCVIIPCEFNQKSVQKTIWLKNPEYDHTINEFVRTIAYDDETSLIDPAFRNRTEYLGNKDGNCTLKINDLQLNDTGDYKFRFKTATKSWISLSNVSITVHENPCKVIITGPPSVTEGESISVICATKGQCRYSPEWKRPFEYQVSSDYKSETVTITPSWQNHLQTLTCQLKGDNDKCNKRTFVLLVKDVPNNVQVRFNHTENGKVKENETLTVTCEVKHSYPNVISYSFMRNEQDLQNGSSSEFVISKVSENDTGVYSCNAFNEFGSAMSQKLNLDVQYPPKEMEINAVEDKDKLKEGQSVTFNCIYQRSNPLATKYVWYKNRIPLQNEMKKTLTIKNISYTSNKGKIECEAQNEIGGTRSKQLTLNVMHSPKETNATVNNLIIKEDTRVTIICVTKANPQASYHWFKDGRPWKMVEASEYIFNKIMISDSGNYFCQASNQEGNQNSSIIQLDVIYAPKDVQLEMNPSSMVKEGDLVLLNCTIGRSNPPVSSVTWYRNSIEIKRESTRSLEFEQIHHNQSGTYYCDATNSVGNKQSNRIEMNILYGPTGTSIETNVKTNQVKVGRNIVLECHTSSNPASHFTWHKNDSGSWKQQEPVGYQLTFQQITISNGGYFFCTAENDINSANSSIFYLDVLYPPTTPKMTFENNAREGFEAFVECQVKSNPPAQLSISHIDKKSRDVKMMSDINVLKMRFMNLTSKDAGQYLCRADNTEGKSETKGDFIVKYSPKDVSLTVSPSRVIENKPAKLVCDSDAYPPSSRYSWFKLQGDSQHKVGDNKELFFSSVSIQDSAHYLCTADNSMGQGHSQKSYLDVLYQPKKVRVLHNIGSSGVKQGDTVVLSCSCVSNPPANVYRWHKITENNMRSVVDNEQNITIHDFSVQHEGYYYCTAQNLLAGESSQQISLFLFSKFVLFFTKLNL